MAADDTGALESARLTVRVGGAVVLGQRSHVTAVVTVIHGEPTPGDVIIDAATGERFRILQLFHVSSESGVPIGLSLQPLVKGSIPARGAILLGSPPPDAPHAACEKDQD